MSVSATYIAENIQAIHRNAGELLRFTSSLPSFHTLHADLLTTDELYTLFRLSGDIAYSLDTVATLCAEGSTNVSGETNMIHSVVPSSFPVEEASESLLADAVAKTSLMEGESGSGDGTPKGFHQPHLEHTEQLLWQRTSKAHRHHHRQFVCYQCAAVDTPEWRTGPDGLHTLCNVCGLVYAKREQRTAACALTTI